MTILIDINVLHLVFNFKEKNDFTPVRDWLNKTEKASIVIGGSRYMEELKRAGGYIQLFKQLKDRRKNIITAINKKMVDETEASLKSNQNHDFDDPHLVALLDCSGCLLFCSKDQRSYKFIKNTSLYKYTRKKRKIYCRAENENILNRNIVNIINKE